MTDAFSVLVVDDNTDLAEDVQEILEDEGLDVDVAGNGVEALRRLDDKKYALVLTDMRMPEMDGLELVLKIKEHTPEVTVLLMTAYSDHETLDKAQEAGALMCMPKPLNLDRLIGLMGRILQGQRVLVLDDDKDLRTNLTEALLEEGSLVPVPAADLETAHRLARRLAFAAAILDIRLPDGSGTEIIEQLRSETQDPVKVVLCSGYLNEESPQCSHCVMELSKPVNPGTLAKALEELGA